LLTVRSTLRAGCSALCGLPVGALPGDLGTGGRGGCADRGGVGRDGLRSSGMAPVHDHDLATTVYQRTTRADDRSLLTITIGERPPNSGRVRRVWWILFCGSRRPCRPGSAGQGSASQGSASQGSASQGSAGQGSAGQAAAYRADTRGHHRGSGECGLPDLLRAAAAGFDWLLIAAAALCVEDAHPGRLWSHCDRTSATFAWLRRLTCSAPRR
jgi:hypothetical protein